MILVLKIISSRFPSGTFSHFAVISAWADVSTEHVTRIIYLAPSIVRREIIKQMLTSSKNVYILVTTYGGFSKFGTHKINSCRSSVRTAHARLSDHKKLQWRHPKIEEGLSILYGLIILWIEYIHIFMISGNFQIQTTDNVRRF